MNGLKAATNGVKRIDVNDWDRLYDNHLAPWKVRETGMFVIASSYKEIYTCLIIERNFPK